MRWQEISLEENNMKSISFAFPVKYGIRGPKEKYMPAIINLGDEICKCYGISFPRNYVYTDEPINKFCLSRIPTIISRYIIGYLQKIVRFPEYYIYWSNIIVFDLLFSRRISRDESKIVFTHPLLNRTIEKCKKAGKIVVVEAPNSDPRREHSRIMRDYELFHIKNKFIYGNKMFRDMWIYGYDSADKIIAISNLSLNTYLNAGYPEEKFEMIPLTGSEFVKTNKVPNLKKDKAFITCAHHSFIKGTHRLLLAWKKANIKDIKLYVVGKLCEDMKEFVDNNGPFENVIFTGELTDLPELYNRLDGVGVQLSLSEGAVRVTPEMMAFGFPMVTTIDASCDLVIDGKTGFIVDVENEEEIIKTLTHISTSWNDLSNLKENIDLVLRGRTVCDFSSELGKYLKQLADDGGISGEIK